MSDHTKSIESEISLVKSKSKKKTNNNNNQL
jgi:hypothetical protein